MPVRYDVPFRGKVSFSIEGMVSERRIRDGGRFNLSFSNSFRCDSAPVLVDVRPLPKAGQPADFSGIISEGLALFELPDILRVETNDVVTITYRMRVKGYIPPGWQPRDVAFEWSRRSDGSDSEIEYRRFFVADGARETPLLTVHYFDPRKKAYSAVTAGGTKLVYVSEQQ